MEKVKRIRAFSAMTDDDFDRRFPDEKSAIDYYIDMRYKGNLVCPHCGKDVSIYRERKRLKVFHCNNCENSFSPLKGTIFQKTHIEIRKWFKAIVKFLNNRHGYSACNIQRDFKITYEASLRMLHQIRIAMANRETEQLFEAIVEADETYIGGKPKRINAILDEKGNVINKTRPNAKRGRGTKKVPVVGIKERSTGHVYAKVMLPDENGHKLTGKQLLDVIESSCKEGTTVMTDDNPAYNILNKGVNKEKYLHFTVNHSKGQYYAGDGVHTNGIENFWSVVKNGVRGSYHHFSVKYMQRYIDEYYFKQNTRTCTDMFDIVLDQSLLKKGKSMKKDEDETIA